MSFVSELAKIELELCKRKIKGLSIDDIYNIVDAVREDYIVTQQLLQFHSLIYTEHEHRIEEVNGALPLEEYTIINLDCGLLLLMYY